MSKSTTRKNRQTGTMITVISEAEGQLDADLKWWTICEDHDRLVGHYSKADAVANASDPLGWCGVCNGTEAEELAREAELEAKAEQRDSVDMTEEELAEQREIMMADLLEEGETMQTLAALKMTQTIWTDWMAEMAAGMTDGDLVAVRRLHTFAGTYLQSFRRVA